MDETPASSRLAEVQDRAEETEITESVRATRPMLLSRMSGAEEEMSASLQKELPRMLIDKGGGAAGVEEEADERLMMQELSKAGDQTVEKETLEKEQPAELLSPEKCVDSQKAKKRKWKALMFDLESGGKEQSAENNKKERTWGKENKKEEVQVLGNTVQRELRVLSHSLSLSLCFCLSV